MANPITISEIKSRQILSATLLAKISSRDIRQAITEKITLADLERENTEEYAENFVVSMVDYICNSFQRREPMSKEERKELAQLILRRNQHLTIGDCRVFADMVVAGELNSGTAGRDEYKLIDVNKAGILDKLRVYKARRSETLARMEEEFKQTMQNESVGTTKHKLSPYMLTHDYEGKKMPAGWDAEKYWYGIPTQQEIETIIWPRIQTRIAAFYAKQE